MSRILERAHLEWPFNGSAAPHVRIGGRRWGYGRSEQVDPFPAYAHDAALVRRTLRLVEAAVSVKFKPTIYLLHFDTPARTNGWAYRDWDYSRNSEDKRWEGHIVLAAKRIPPHPAVTRYVVAHEYGHHVEWEVERRKGYPGDGNLVRDEYAELRGLDPDVGSRYGGGKWHSNTGEVLANDFRILVAGIEPEYWPHDCPRPQKLKRLERWWSEALA